MWFPALMAMAVAATGWYLFERHRRRVGVVEPGFHEEVELPHTGEFELWHNGFSLCSKKIRVCLVELGIDWVDHPVELIETGAYGNLNPEFLRVNPAATVPVLVHAGHPVYESHEQIRYAARWAERSLIPDDPAQQRRMEAWVDRAALIGDDPLTDTARSAGNCVPGLTLPLFAAMNQAIPWRRFLTGVLFHRLRMRPLGMILTKLRGVSGLLVTPPMAKAMAQSWRDMRLHLQALEQDLTSSGGPFIVGAQFTLADVGVMVVLDRLDEGFWLAGLCDGLPRVQAYWDLLRSRDSFRVAVDGYRHPTVDAGRKRLRVARERDPAFAAVLARGFG